jgi:phosphate:Na+ symporter
MTILGFFSLLGGVGLFLYGMTIMSTGLKNAAGDQMRVILEHATSNRFVAVLVGIGVTVLIQSSSATDMMVIGFVNSGLMTLAQAIGVIMGANIGTTITAQITAFNLGAYAPLILFVGAIMYLFLKQNLVKHIGSIVMGFGMLFLGISIIKSAISPLSESEPFVHFLSTLSNPALAVLFGVAFTALLQSSSSSVVIFQAFAVQGLLTYDIAVYLCIGAAIGSVFPNILASLTTNRNGKRTACLNLLFNLFRALILIVLINVFPFILTGIKSLSPNDVGRQVANTHTIFAILAVLLELPWSRRIVALSQKLIPIRPEEARKLEDRKLQYMISQQGSLIPAVAIKQARLEISRMGKLARDNLQLAIDSFFELDDSKAAEVEEIEDTVNYLNHEITDRLVKLRSLDMSDRDRKRVSQMTLVVADIERISDHAENIVEYEAQVKGKKAVLSQEALDELRRLSEASVRSVDLCLHIFAEEDFDKIQQAEDLEDYVDELQKEIVNNHVARLMDSKCDPLGGVVFTDMSTDLERCSDHAINIATALIENYDYQS